MKKVFNLHFPDDWFACIEYIKALRSGVKYTVTIQKYRKKRSLNANAYYWSVCIPALAEHLGYRIQDMHTAILGEYVGWEQRNFRGHLLHVPRRTSTTPEVMDTMDFQGLIQTAQQIAAEEGLILPEQHEQNHEGR